jgi:hypothetical protein
VDCGLRGPVCEEKSVSFWDWQAWQRPTLPSLET